MKRAVLISCVSKKKSKKSKAQDLYISPLFKMGLLYARSLKPDYIFILSAKYGLIDLEKQIEPYNQTLTTMTTSKRKTWSEKFFASLMKKIDVENTEIIFLAGMNYRKNLLPLLPHYSVPMKNLGIGKQLQFLKQHTS